MKHFLKIRRFFKFSNGNISFTMWSGNNIYYDGNRYVIVDTNEVVEPLYDEFTDELIGFIK